MPLSQEQIEFYRINGYLLIENLMNREMLNRIHQKIDEYVDRARTARASNEIFDIGPGHTPERPALRRLKDPCSFDPVFRDLAWSNTIVDPVAELLGGTVRFDHSKLNFKPPCSDASIQWHQDWAFYPHSNDDILAVGIMLEDCTPHNGPMMVIPGSHRGPVYDHHVDGIFAGGIKDKTITGPINNHRELLAPAGSVTIHHVRTLHSSGNNRTDSNRPFLIISYAAVDAFPILQHYDIEEFDSRIIRGEPTLQGRMVAAPFRIAQPQGLSADSIYDNQDILKAAKQT